MKQILVAFALMAALLQAQPASALSCLPAGPIEDDFRTSAAVFAGTVTEVDYPGTQNFGDKNYTSFQVQKIYKGDLPKFLVIQTDSLWGATFEVGKQYLVYLDGTEPYTIELCRFATKELGSAADDIKMMEKLGVKPYTPFIPRMDAQAEEASLLEYVSGAALLILDYIAFRHFYPPHGARK